MEYSVSVIIPVYNVGKFIERCARSLMEQTIDNVEYIFVDDASPDNSIQILQKVLADYPNRRDNVRILTHAENKGLPAARNTGLAVAQGKYIFHCDSDDFVEPDMLEQLYGKAIKCDADIVWCDWYLTFENSERYMKQPAYDTPLEALKAMLSGVMKYNVWNKLVRRSIYVENKIDFPAGYGMGEDMTIMLLFVYAERISYLPHAFYHYVKLNTNAFSQTYSKRHLLELQHNVTTITDKLETLFGNTLEQEISFMKLEAKFPFLLSDDSEKRKLWQEWYPEANRFILQNHNISMRSRIIQWCAWKHLNFIVNIYRLLLNRIIYGIIYK
mgnify:CR=1 FL=1